jgi:hypothetical protein
VEQFYKIIQDYTTFNVCDKFVLSNSFLVMYVQYCNLFRIGVISILLRTTGDQSIFTITFTLRKILVPF